jgi:hypothetical protein
MEEEKGRNIASNTKIINVKAHPSIEIHQIVEINLNLIWPAEDIEALLKVFYL